MREAGLDVEDRLVFQAGSTIEDGARAGLQMFAESCDVTAIQTVTDLIAIGCADALFSKGIRIPEDISLVGFGNIITAEYFRVPLTTVRQPKFRLGMAAVDSMMNLLQGRVLKPNVCPPNSSSAKAPRRPRRDRDRPKPANRKNSHPSHENCHHHLVCHPRRGADHWRHHLVQHHRSHAMSPPNRRVQRRMHQPPAGPAEIQGIHGSYPAGNNLDVARALSGQSSSKILIILATKIPRNSKGEFLDPWDTPLQFYFSGNSVLIRSAGPNKVWEDSTVPNSDDLYRSN